LRAAASRALCTAGISRAIKTWMMAITTSSSMRVKPRVKRLWVFMASPESVCGRL